MKFLNHTLKRTCVAALAAVVGCIAAGQANADIVEVTVTNNAPTNGVFLTPVWAGFHNGSFDSYDGGTASSIQLSRLAEDGNVNPISQTFGANGTLVNTAISQTGARVQGVLGAAPLAPGESATFSFDVDISVGGANQFFSYASMLLPTNDYFIANGNPTAFDLSSLSGTAGTISFDVFTVNDAGTEINDFEFSAGNGLFPGLGLPAGQGGPNQGADEFGTIENVNNPFANFLNTPGGADLSDLDFTDATAYPNGVATFTITTSVPEPSSVAFGAICGLGLIVRRRR